MSQARTLILVTFVFALTPHPANIPWWASMVCAILTAWAILVEYKKITALPKSFINVVALLFPAVVYYEFRTLLGPDAATPLLIVLASLKLNEVQKNRDVIIILFICLLIAMYALLFSQSILMTLYMLAVVLATTVAFLVHHTPQKKIKQILLFTRKVVFIDFALCIPIFLLFFFLFPRFQTPWGRILSKPKTTVGFSDTFSPGDLASLVQSEDPAFSVQFSNNKKPKPSSLYWRGIVLERTDGWKWFKSPNRKSALPAEDASESNTDISYQVFLESKFEKVIFALESPLLLDMHSFYNSNPIDKYDDQTFSTKWNNVNRISYTGSSSLNRQTGFRSSPRPIQSLLQVPGAKSAKITNLVQQLKLGTKTRRDIANNALNYFSNNKFQYSFIVPEMRTVDDFLFNYRLGFCEHYSGAFTLLMRLAGVPSRVVIGFHGGTYNDYSDYLLVRDKEAHSWSEILTEDNTWIRVDPTLAIHRFRIDSGSLDALANANANRIQQLWLKTLMIAQALDSTYTTFLLNYSFKEQLSLFKLNNLNIKKWHLFVVLVTLSGFLFYLLSLSINSSSKNTDPISEHFYILKEKLVRLGIKIEHCDGPLKIKSMIQSQNHLPVSVPTSDLIQIINAYTTLRYGKDFSSKTQAESFIKAVRKLNVKPRV